jgi:hypothetical protein
MDCAGVSSLRDSAVIMEEEYVGFSLVLLADMAKSILARAHWYAGRRTSKIAQNDCFVFMLRS